MAGAMFILYDRVETCARHYPEDKQFENLSNGL